MKNINPEILIMKYEKFLHLKGNFEINTYTNKKTLSIFLNSHNDYLEMPVQEISKVIITNSTMTIFSFDNSFQVSFEMKDSFETSKIKINEFWEKNQEKINNKLNLEDKKMTVKEIKEYLNKMQGTFIKEAIISYTDSIGTRTIDFYNLKGFDSECLNFKVLNWEKSDSNLLFIEVSKEEFLEALKNFYK